MKFLSCHNGKLHVLSEQHLHAPPIGGGGDNGGGGAGGEAMPRRHGAFITGLSALDEVAPGGAFARGAVHEILCDPADGTPLFFAMLLAGNAAGGGGWGVGGKAKAEGALSRLVSHPHSPTPAASIVWCDPHGTLYPPALAAHGVPPGRLFLLRPPVPDRPLSAADQVWAAAECLRCPGVGAVVASLAPGQRLTRVEARRLQLAAERGGGVGVLLRPTGNAPGGAAGEHAATTRWLVGPHPGERAVQRWKVQLIHGHGGRVGQAVILEHNRERRTVQARPLHRAAELADRPRVSQAKTG